MPQHLVIGLGLRRGVFAWTPGPAGSLRAHADPGHPTRVPPSYGRQHSRLGCAMLRCSRARGDGLRDPGGRAGGERGVPVGRQGDSAAGRHRHPRLQARGGRRRRLVRDRGRMGRPRGAGGRRASPERRILAFRLVSGFWPSMSTITHRRCLTRDLAERVIIRSSSSCHPPRISRFSSAASSSRVATPGGRTPALRSTSESSGEARRGRSRCRRGGRTT